MSFSSDLPQRTDQYPSSITLPDLKDGDLFVERVEGYLKQISDAVNKKQIGANLLEEKGTGAQFYNSDPTRPLRNVYRKTFDLIAFTGGNIDPGQTVQFPHEIENLRESAGILAHCTATDGVIFTASHPDVCLNQTSVIFTNTHTNPLTQCDIVADILKEA